MKKIVIPIIAALVIAATAIGVIFVRSTKPQSVISDVYSDKEYIEEINRIELNGKLAAAVDGKDLYKVKMAVLENKISEENQEKLVPLIEEYGVEDTLIGYSYLNSDYVTWDVMEDFIQSVDKNGAEKAIKQYEEKAPVYSPSTFKRSQLEEWINVKGYPAADITAMDKLTNLCGADFNSLMARYESGESIGTFKAELGLVNTNSDIEYVTLEEKDIQFMIEKYGIDEQEAENVLTSLTRLKFDVSKLGEVSVSNEYQLLSMILEEKYGGKSK